MAATSLEPRLHQIRDARVAQAPLPCAEGDHWHHDVWPIVVNLHGRHCRPEGAQCRDFQWRKLEIENCKVALHVSWVRGRGDYSDAPVQTPPQRHLCRAHVVLHADALDERIIKGDSPIVPSSGASAAERRVGLQLDAPVLAICEKLLVVPT
eukprot:CAMPEP_0117469106 /NCGR_PEP_ID=MMETSP0784-20121206/6520_1 /TAXON_ID=39447 /ORGANISM="" /LENGTH=151 /DNA_ID=CAMNT_0005263135 /DNA_START=404 /DNA_END=859 /DNA_ORIENTATION=-